MTTQNKYNFIANEPLGEDLFKNKSQDKIATVIKEKIIHDNKFQIIGIDGEWGAGKSNLVRILSSKLDDKHIFFTYDVWGHQEDDQRRSILVELTDHLTEKSVLKNKKTWENRLKKLLGREREVTTINRPYLSLGVIFTLFAIVYTPIITTFKADIGDTYFKLELGKSIWQLLFICIPIFMILLIYVWHFFRERKKEGIKNALKTALHKTYQVYSNKQIDETKIETISERNPSVKDFTDWINDINNDLGDKKLIIVFDNFDRLPKKHIINLWSSIHIFFAEKIDQKTNSNIKVILPFDKGHILQAFSDLYEKGGSKESYADDYINKTFDIVFRVSLPLLSDWKEFFSDKWEKAFPNYSDQTEYHKVLEIYEFLNRKITPREIISFLNEIVSIKLLDEGYGLPYVAIFALCKETILADPLKSLVDLSYLLGLSEQYKNDKEFSKQITAIVYQIKPDKNAVELIYTHQLKDALLNEDVYVMNDICKTDFANHIILSAVNSLPNHVTAIETFNNLLPESQLTDEIITSIWDTLYFKTYQNNEIEFGISKYQSILLERCNYQVQYLEILIYNLDNHKEFYPPSYAYAINTLSEKVPSVNVFHMLEDIEIDPASFINLVNEFNDYKKFKLFVSENELDEYLAKKDLKAVENIKSTVILVEDFELPKYRESLLKMYESSADDINHNKNEQVLNKLKEFRLYGKTNDRVPYLNDFQIFNFIAGMKSIEDSNPDFKYDLIAMTLISYYEISSSYKSSISGCLDDLSEEEVAKVANSVLFYISFGDLLLKHINLNKIELFHKVLRYLVNNEVTIKKELNINDILLHYDHLINDLKDDGISLTAIEKYNTVEFSLEISDISIKLTESCFGDNPDLDISKQILNQLRDYYKNLDITGWKELFTNEDNELFQKFHYVPEIFNNNAFIAWSDIYQQKLVNSERESDEFSWILDYAINSKANVAFEDFLKGLKNNIYKDYIEVSNSFFSTFFPLFKEYNIFESDSSEVFRTFFNANILSSETVTAVIIEDLPYLQDLYELTADENKKSFKLFIRENANGNERLEKIAKALKISVIRRKKEDNGK